MTAVNKYLVGSTQFETWLSPIDNNENYLVYFKQREENKIRFYKAVIVYLGTPNVVETKEYTNLPNLLRAYNWLNSCDEIKFAPVEKIDIEFGTLSQNQKNKPSKCDEGFCEVNIIK